MVMELKDLENFKMYNLAKQIVQYQNFKTNIAISKIQSDYKQSSVKTYFDNAIRYLKSGDCEKMNRFLVDALDKVKSEHIQPLTPKESERRLQHKNHIRKEYKKETRLPIQDIDVVSKPMVTRFDYALRSGNKVMIVDEKDCDSFISLAKFFGVADSIYKVRVEVDS